MDPAITRRSVPLPFCSSEGLAESQYLDARSPTSASYSSLPGWLPYFSAAIPFLKHRFCLLNIRVLPFFDQVAGPTYTVYVIRISGGSL
jgi:hypothetical protein